MGGAGLTAATDTTEGRKEADRSWVTECLPLPTVDDIAVPILRGLNALWELSETGEGMCWLSSMELEVGEWTRLGRELLDVRRRVVDLVVAAFDSRTAVMSDLERDSVRHALERLSSVGELEMLIGHTEVNTLLH